MTSAVSEGQLMRLTEVHNRCQWISGREWTPVEFREYLASEGVHLWEKRGKVSQQFGKDAITVSDFVKVCTRLEWSSEHAGDS